MLKVKTHGEKLLDERRALLSEAQAITERAKADGRDFVGDEQATVEAKLDRVREIDDWRAKAAGTEDIMSRIAKTGDVSLLDGGGFTEEKGALLKSLRNRSPYTAHVERKALSTVGLSLPSSGEGVAGAQPGTAATALRDLFQQIPTESPTIRYYVVGPVTGGPDVVAEGALKPEMVGQVTPKDAAMVKLAGRFVHTTEMDDDAPFILSEIFRQALLTLVRRENQLVLDTMDAATGVATAEGPAAKALDAIAGAIGFQESVNGLTPDALVINPVDLAALRTVKSSGSGEYTLDPLGSGPAAIFGVPVLPTPALEAGTVWLLRKEAGLFYQRKQVAIVSAPAGDDMNYNRVTTVVEERVLPVITQPGLLTKITLE